MYDQLSTSTSVDEDRPDMFASKQRLHEAFPPTRVALTYFSPLNELHFRQSSCDLSQLRFNQKQRVLLTEDGRRYVKNIGSTGQLVHQLQRIVNNSLSVAASQGTMKNSNDSHWVSLAQHCAVANEM